MSYIPFTPQGNILRLYHSVINDVVEGIRELFLDEGIDEQVLQDLKQIWEAKLESTRALEAPTNNENRSQSRQLHIPAKMEPLDYQHRLPILQQMNCSAGIPISTVIGRPNTMGHPQTILIQPSTGVVLPPHALLQQQQLQQLHLSGGNHNAVNLNNFIKEEPRLVQNQQIRRGPITIDNSSLMSKPNVVVQVDGNTIRLDNQRNPVSNLLFINQHNGNAGQIPCQRTVTQDNTNTKNPVDPSFFVTNDVSSFSHKKSVMQVDGEDGNMLVAEIGSNSCCSINDGRFDMPELEDSKTCAIKNLKDFKPCESTFFALEDALSSKRKSILQMDGGTENDSSEDELVRVAESVSDVTVDRIKEDSDPLNSDDDVSEEDPLELFETENVIVCQFDKINRSKARWKFMLKDGIMNISGKDYVFSKAQGEAEW